MLQAVLKLILLSVGFIILTVFALVFVRWVGLQQSFAPPPHPWFSKPFWLVFTPTPEEICNTEQLQTLLPSKNKEDWIVALPIKRDPEDRWVIPCAKPLELGELLKRDQQADFVLNVQAHDTWALDKLVAVVAPFDTGKRFALLTDSQKVALFLRKKAPQWLFAADPSSIARLKFFESLWIDPAMDFWPDFVVSTFSRREPVQIDERMAQELDRRKKRILWKVEQNASERPHISIQGAMTNRPSSFTHE